MDAIAAFADHATRTRFADLPSEAVRAAKIFMLDTLGVGIGGSSFRTAGFPQYGWKAGLSGGAFPSPDQLKPAPGMR